MEELFRTLAKQRCVSLFTDQEKDLQKYGIKYADAIRKGVDIVLEQARQAQEKQ